MNIRQATADVFFTAFKALPGSERAEVLMRMVEDPSIRKDLMDLEIFAQRKDEPSRPFSEYLAEREK